MGKIIKNNVTYGGVPDEVITAWETEDVQDLSEIEYGDADISGIGDGSLTGAIAEHEDNINDIDEAIGNTNISSIGDGTVTGAISSLNSKSMHWPGADVNSFDSMPEGISCFYISSMTGIMTGWYFCLKCSPSNASKEILLIGTSVAKIYAVQYRNSQWNLKTIL